MNLVSPIDITSVTSSLLNVSTICLSNFSLCFFLRSESDALSEVFVTKASISPLSAFPRLENLNQFINFYLQGDSSVSKDRKSKFKPVTPTYCYRKIRVQRSYCSLEFTLNLFDFGSTNLFFKVFKVPEI